MNDPADAGRRRLLLSAAGLAVGLAFAPLRLPTGTDVTVQNAGARFGRLLGWQDSARVIGREYLRVVPEEATLEGLVEFLTTDVAGGHRGLGRVSDSHLRTLVVHRSREDFARERMVELEGWIVSITEARLCAVAALV